MIERDLASIYQVENTGKSNLFEALIEIFRHIVEFYRDKASCDFNYRIGSDGTGQFQFGLVSGDIDSREEQCGNAPRFNFS